MKKIEALGTSEEYHAFRRSFRRSLERDAGTVDGKKSLTEIDVIHDADGDPFWMIARNEIRPGAPAPPVPEVKYVPLADTYEIRRLVPEMRTQYLPPFDPGVKSHLLRPQTDIMSSNDIVVFGPTAVQMMESIDLDFESIERDVESTYNLGMNEMDGSARDGIEWTRAAKDGVLSMRKDLQRQLDRAYEHTLGFRPQNNPSLRRRSTADQFNFYRMQVEDFGRREPELLREEGSTLAHLQSLHLDVEDAVRDTEIVGVQAFRDTVQTGGILLPSTCAPEEAISRLGLGTRSHLLI